MARAQRPVPRRAPTGVPIRVAIRALLILGVLALVSLPPRSARAWIENHVLGDEVRIEIERSGKAVVAHRLTLKTNGSIRLRRFIIAGVDRDAAPLDDAYAVPERDAMSSSLDNAVPLNVKRLPSTDPDKPVRLELEIDDRKGLRRGTYVLVFSYATDLAARDRITPDGAMLRITWQGPRYADGFDNARATFVVPAATTAPRAAKPEEGDLSSTFLDEVHRGTDHDEVALLRTYARKDEPIRWRVRVDRRALDLDLGGPAAPPTAIPTPPLLLPAAERLTAPPRGFWIAFAVVAALFGGLTALRRWEVRRSAAARPLVRLPIWLASPLAGLSLATGLGLQLFWERAFLGAMAIAVATSLVAHGGAQRGEPSMRGPGHWLSLTEQEGLGRPPRPRGAWLDASTRPGGVLFSLLILAHGGVTWWVGRQSWLLAVQIGLDAVVWLALFGTGRLAAMPPDMAVEPARWLRRFVVRLRRHRGLKRLATELRVVPRIRVPRGDVDPDELRLMIAPRHPPRGLSGIEVALTYATGFGARVAMPEVLLRVQEDSPAHVALESLASSARVVPGRRPDERVFVFTPRLPTVGMTVDIVVALLARIAEVPAAAPRKRRRPSRQSRTSTAPAQPAPVQPEKVQPATAKDAAASDTDRVA